jgi:hypothetical protein
MRLLKQFLHLWETPTNLRVRIVVLEKVAGSSPARLYLTLTGTLT